MPLKTKPWDNAFINMDSNKGVTAMGGIDPRSCGDNDNMRDRKSEI